MLPRRCLLADRQNQPVKVLMTCLAMQTPLSGPVAISSDSDSEEPGTATRRVEIGDQAVVVLMYSRIQGI
jgi:hypothetical protein